MSSSSYVIRGGIEGRERLRILSRVMSPTTQALFERVGIPSAARCLDVGCGGGDVSFELARRAPDGLVVGIDLDETVVNIAREEADAAGLGNVTFRVGDATGPSADDEPYDLVYLRFLLTHLRDPGSALAHLRAQLAPGGVIIVEDIDFRGHFCHPDSPAFWRYVEWYGAAVRARGGDPDIGPRLPSLLDGAGFEAVGMNVVQPAGASGEVKLIAPITLEAVAGSLLAASLTTLEELEATVDELYDFAKQDGTVLSVPRIVQAWGRRV